MSLPAWLRPAGRPWPPEDSVILRASSAAAVCVAIAACTSQQEVPASLGSVAVLLVGAGNVFSYRTRARPRPRVKLALGAVLVGAFTWFFVSVSADAHTGSLVAVEDPLAVLFAVMQAAHAWDLPTRRDLGFALAGSATLVAVAAAQAVTLTFGVFVAAWGLCALVAAAAAWSSMAGGTRVRPLGVLASAGATLAVGALSFALLPAPQPPGGARALGEPGPGDPAGQASRLVRPHAASGEASASPSGPTGVGGYLGFAGPLDTALRPGLRNEVVLHVRADRPTFWLAETFDAWSGQAWSERAPASRPPRTHSGRTGPQAGTGVVERRPPRGWTVLEGGPPFLLTQTVVVPPGLITPPPSVAAGPRGGETGDHPRGGTIVGIEPAVGSDYQTFYLASGASDLVLHAVGASTVWAPTGRLEVGAGGTLRTGQPMGAGSVYSVLSTVGAPSPADLRRSNGTAGLARALGRQDLSLPRPYPRVAALARHITARSRTTYAKVRALERWIGGHTRYTLDIPPLQPGQDTVTQFLFKSRRGFCEQISTSLAVMLRTLGIPAREAVGYVPGTYDPLTGLYEERAKDAHAWVQVWFPGYGWQSFDPTAYVPLANPTPAASVGHAVWSALRHVPLPASAGGASALVLLVLALVAWRRRPRTWHAAVTRELERAARRSGFGVGPADSIRATGARVDGAMGPCAREPTAAALAAVAERAAFGGLHVTRPAARRHVRDARRLRRAAARTGNTRPGVSRRGRGARARRPTTPPRRSAA